MSLQPPVIVSPITNWVPGYNDSYYTKDLIQQILGSIPIPLDLPSDRLLTVAYSYRIKRNNVWSSFTSYTMAGIVVGITNTELEDVAWSFNSEGYISLQEGDTLTLRLKALAFVNQIGGIGTQVDESDPVDLIAYIVNINSINTTATIPTGIQIKLFKDSMKILIPKDPLLTSNNSDFLGCNFYISLYSGGGQNGYQLMNDVYINIPDSSETIQTTTTTSDASSASNGINIETIKTVQNETEYYTYTIDKTILKSLINDGKIENVFLSDNDTINEDIVFYYTTTSVAYDKTLNTVIESFYSLELNGKFLKYKTDFKGLPLRTRQDILFSIVKRLTTNNSKVNVVTGQVIRDIIDPITDMFTKFYTIEDFVFRCESIDSLVSFDDSNGDGISDDPASSPLKINLADALGITDSSVLQLLIDEQFDKQASDFSIVRNPAMNAKGKVVLFTTRRPTYDILIADGTIVSYPGDMNSGIPPVTYSIIGNRIIEASTIDNYYNPATKRYEVQADIIATTEGKTGNVPAGAITNVSGADPSIQVINNVPADKGTDKESNTELASRIKMARPSFDSGTKPGYTARTYDIPGVQEVIVQEAGDSLMARDFDEESKEHIGGKVDIYIRGERESQIIDQMAFKFEYPTDVVGNEIGETFYVIDAKDFRIKASNPKVTPDNPITIVNKIRNVTRKENYDLTDMDVMDDTLILSSTSQTNIRIGMSTFDAIEVDYRYRSSNVLILQHQPVHTLVSVVDKDGNIVDSSKYQLIKTEDPLDTGNSSISKCGIEFLFEAGDIEEEFVIVTNEQHSIRTSSPAQLNFKGIVLESVVVKSSTDPSIIYRKGIDYTVTLGDQIKFTYINLISNGMIRSGDIIAVDYESSPNYFVTYIYNSLVEQVQSSIDNMKHAAADTIIKEAVENMVDLSFNVEKDLSIATITGTQTDDEMRLRSRIQTAIYNAVAGLKTGKALTQSYLLKTILSVTGVKSVETPFQIMMKREGSYIPLDDLGILPFETFQRSTSGGVVSYKTINPVLTYSTSANGGSNNLFRAVYEDMYKLELVNDPTLVAKKAGRANIMSDGRIVISTTDGRPPQTKYYMAAYYVAYPVGVSYVQDIKTNQIEYLNVDNLSFKGIDFIN